MHDQRSTSNILNMKESHMWTIGLVLVVLSGLVLMGWGIHDSLHSVTLVGGLIAILTSVVIYNINYQPDTEEEKPQTVENPIQVVVADLPKDAASQDPVNV